MILALRPWNLDHTPGPGFGGRGTWNAKTRGPSACAEFSFTFGQLLLFFRRHSRLRDNVPQLEVSVLLLVHLVVLHMFFASSHDELQGKKIKGLLGLSLGIDLCHGPTAP